MNRDYTKSVRISEEANDLLSKKANELGVSKTLILNWLITENIESISVKFELPSKEGSTDA